MVDGHVALSSRRLELALSQGCNLLFLLVEYNHNLFF